MGKDGKAMKRMENLIQLSFLESKEANGKEGKGEKRETKRMDWDKLKATEIDKDNTSILFDS